MGPTQGAPGAPAHADAPERLARRTLELVNIFSVSRSEAELAAYVQEHAAGDALDVRLSHDDCVFLAPRAPAGGPFVVLAGHLDTVPEQGNFPGSIHGEVIRGLGAADMKGGLAVMIELARWLDDARPAVRVDTGFLFFSREELPFTESPVGGLLGEDDLLRSADVVILLEPTSNAIQAGCLGNLNAEAVFSGRSAHSARPWLGDNAVHRAVESLLPLVTADRREVKVDGLTFVEVASVTGFEAGIANNVIPDRARAMINFRYAPNRLPQDAVEQLRSLLGKDIELDIIGNAPPGRVVVDNPLVQRLRSIGNFAIEPKQAWTNVAEFTAAGIDAINFGPGNPDLAHRPDERVDASSLGACFETLKRFVAQP